MRWAAVLLLAAALVPLLDLARTGRRTAPLAARPVDESPAAWPRLSVVVAARNEAAHVAAAARSLVTQDYPELEVVLVNDRSTDATADVLSAVAREFPSRLRVVTIDALPPRWLGKNHALSVGARQSTGAWLLFTDADVVFAPGALRRAVAYAESSALDHLTLGPTLVTAGFWLGAFVAMFTHLMVLSLRLYRVNDPRSDVGIGLGAFNLVRRGAYEAIGTHAAIAMRPDDDIRLGQRLRALGFAQQLLDGTDLLSVEWYPSLGAAVLGLEKNFFAAFDYRLSALLANITALLTVFVSPVVALPVARGWTRVLLVAAATTNAATFLVVRRSTASRLRPVDVAYAAALPVSALFVGFTAIRSAVLTVRQGGIRWRDTFYPLRDLRG